MSDTLPKNDVLLKVEALNCSFDGLRAVADLSFAVRAGEIKAVIGPNGAGKSTLFNAIAGVTRPASGRIWLRDRRIDTLPTFRRAQLGIARTFQNLQIFRDMTVVENVMVGCHRHGRVGTVGALLQTSSSRAEDRAMRDRAMRLLARFELDGKADRRAGELAFGQMKLLELARALACEPDLLLLDEPAAGLPQAEAERIGTIITSLNRDGTTVLLVEHNMRMVMLLSHDILVLNNGMRIAEGDAAAIRRHPQVIAAYLGESEYAA
jgi:branched-chain amino acid transport system ATP-binding protein